MVETKTSRAERSRSPNEQELLEPPAAHLQSTPPASPERRLLSNMGKGASVMVLLTLLASATNYASNLIFSRVLEPASYGDLTALLALLVVITVPTGAAQTVIAERVATPHGGRPARPRPRT